MKIKKDLTGQKFGRLVVVSQEPSQKGRTMWKCQCDCGNTVVKMGKLLRNGATRSCGCYTAENRSNFNKKHSQYKTRLYHIWQHMKARCNSERNPKYKDYGGRGIKVCNEWNEFLPFYEWAMANGYSDALSIDRIDNDGDYCPENCRWATNKEQQNNTRKNRLVSYDGKIYTVAELAEKYGIERATMWARVVRGVTGEALTKKPKKTYKENKE